MSSSASSLSQDSTSKKVASKREPLFNTGTFFKFGNSRGPSGSLTTPSPDGGTPEESGSRVVPLDSAESQPSSSSIPDTSQEQVNGKEARGKSRDTVWQPKRSHPYKRSAFKNDGKQEGDGKQKEDGSQKADGPTPFKLQDGLAQIFEAVRHKFMPDKSAPEESQGQAQVSGFPKGNSCSPSATQIPTA